MFLELPKPIARMHKRVPFDGIKAIDLQDLTLTDRQTQTTTIA